MAIRRGRADTPREAWDHVLASGELKPDEGVCGRFAWDNYFCHGRDVTRAEIAFHYRDREGKRQRARSIARRHGELVQRGIWRKTVERPPDYDSKAEPSWAAEPTRLAVVRPLPSAEKGHWVGWRDAEGAHTYPGRFGELAAARSFAEQMRREDGHSRGSMFILIVLPNWEMRSIQV